MMLATLGLLLVVSSVPPPEAHTVVLVARRGGLPAADALSTAQRVAMVLIGREVPLSLDAVASAAAVARLGLPDAAGCNGKRACVLEVARQLNATHVLSVSIVEVANDRSVSLEFLQVSDAALLEKAALVIAKTAEVGVDQLRPFADALLTRLGSKKKDQPLVEQPPLVLAPNVTPPIPGVVDPGPPPQARSHGPQVAMAIGAGAALVAAASLTIAGAIGSGEATRVEVVDGVRRSPWSASEAISRSQTANTELALGGVLGALALGVGIATVVTW